jgi:hypothetical protein
VASVASMSANSDRVPFPSSGQNSPKYWYETRVLAKSTGCPRKVGMPSNLFRTVVLFLPWTSVRSPSLEESATMEVSRRDEI